MKYVHDAISNELRDAIYNHNVKAGWWDEPVRPDGTTIALIHSEVTESWLGLKNNDRQDDHLPQYKNAVVELGDAVIRILDFFGHKKWDVEEALTIVYAMGREVNLDTLQLNADYYCDIHAQISLALEGVRKNQYMELISPTETDPGYGFPVAAFELAIALDMIYACREWGWPLETAIGDKRAYNANRADHKRENRAKDNGKKF